MAGEVEPLIEQVQELQHLFSTDGFHCCVDECDRSFIHHSTHQLTLVVAGIHIFFLDQELVPEPYIKDLSILLDSNLSFNEHTLHR